MERRERLYEGKAKVVYATDDPGRVLIHFKDEATAFDGKKRAELAGKGEANAAIAALLFRAVEEAGVPTHFLEQVGPAEHLVRRLRMIPVEVVFRFVLAGSLAKRLGRPEGEPLGRPVLEYYLKDDALGDPWLNRDHVLALGLAAEEELDEVECLALRAAEALRRRLAEAGIDLVDGKFEFGRDPEGALRLGDEISPDTLRLWAAQGGERLDKDRFRRDLGGVVEAYREVLRRLGGPAAGGS